MTCKKMMAVVLALVLCLALVACGGEPDPHCGVWMGVGASVGDIKMAVSDFTEYEISFELEDGGKGTMTMEGDTYDVEWSIEDGVLTIGDSSMMVSGKITDSKCELNDFGQEGVTVYYEKQ